MEVIVKGVNSKGQESETTYLTFTNEDSFEAIDNAIRWANESYTDVYGETVRDFAEIRSVVVLG